MIIDDHAAVAVEDAAARREDGHRLDAILLGADAVELRVLHLEPPEARDQEQKDGHGDVLKNGNLASREPRVVVQGRLIGEVRFEIRVGRRQDHKGQ